MAEKVPRIMSFLLNPCQYLFDVASYLFVRLIVSFVHFFMLPESVTILFVKYSLTMADGVSF